jgi:tetratricopeptide (TPR) repeat protein
MMIINYMYSTEIDETLEQHLYRLSPDAKHFLYKNLEILKLPKLYPLYKIQFDDVFQQLSHRGMIIEEWESLLERINCDERYIYISLAIQHEINQYNAVKLKKYDIEAITERIRILEQLREIDIGNEVFQKNLLVFYLNLVGYILVAYMDKTNEALPYFSRAIDLDDSVVDNIVSRGTCYHTMGRNEESIVDYSRAIQLSATSQNYEYRGIAYQDMKQHTKAIEDFTKAIELNPKATHLYMWRALSYESTFQSDKQCADYERVIQLDPHNADAHFSMGNVLIIRLAEYERAITYLEKALVIDPNYARAYHVLGYCYERMGNYDAAMVQYDRAINVNPNMAASWFNIGYRYLCNGRYVEALQLINKARLIDPKDTRYLDEHNHIVNTLKNRSTSLGLVVERASEA